MRLRNVIRDDLRRSTARNLPYLNNGNSQAYDAIELTKETIADLEDARPDRRAVKVMPHESGGGIEAAVDLLKAAHPMTGSSTSAMTDAHAFEMRNVDEEIGFQFVMSEPQYQQKISRQLETFYPDSHVEVTELPQPDILPLFEGWHLSMAHLRLEKDATPEQRLFPIKHIDIEGFDNDPFGALTREMVGEAESEDITNVAIQVMFQPAPDDWYKGGLRSPSVDDAADELKQTDENEPGFMDAMLMFLPGGQSFDDISNNPAGSGNETAASKAVRNQRGHKGFSINVRIIAIGQDPREAISRVDDTADMFIGYYDSNTEQGFQTVPLDGHDLLERAHQAHAREYVDRGVTMGERGAAGLVHMPNNDSNTRNVSFSHTSNAGDVPPDQPRFADWNQTGWELPDRSVTMDDGRWIYDLTQRQPTEAEIEHAQKLEADEQTADDDSSDAQSEIEKLAGRNNHGGRQ